MEGAVAELIHRHAKSDALVSFLCVRSCSHVVPFWRAPVA